MAALRFLVQGSADEPYEIIFQSTGDSLRASCSCPAGEVGQACKHRIALMRGEITALVGGDDPASLSALLNDSSLSIALNALDEAETDLERAKRASSPAVRRPWAGSCPEDRCGTYAANKL